MFLNFSWGWATFIGGVVVVLVLIRKNQYRLLYFPQFGFEEARMITPHDSGLSNWKQITIEVDREVNLLAYLVMWPQVGRTTDPDSWKKMPTVLYLHGNAGNIGHRVPIAARLQEAAQCNVVLLAYRGYRGSSSATPSEEGLTRDALAALRHLDTLGLDTSQVFLLGTSLGGAVTIAAAQRAPYTLCGIMVENTFTSISDMTDVLLETFRTRAAARLAQKKRRAASTSARIFYTVLETLVSMLRGTWYCLKPILLSLGWRSLDRVQRLSPDLGVLFLSGAQDELIPKEHMQKLFHHCSSTKKKFISFPEGMHNDTCWRDEWFEEVASWMRTSLQTGSKKRN